MVVSLRQKQVGCGRSAALKVYGGCSIRGLFRPKRLGAIGAFCGRTRSIARL